MQMPTSTSGPTPRFLQVVCQLIGSTVQLPISELLILKDHCNGVGRPFYLGLKELMEALLLGVICPGGIPLHEQLMPFRVC